MVKRAYIKTILEVFMLEIQKLLQIIFQNIPEILFREIVDKIAINIYDRFYCQMHYKLSHYQNVGEFLEELSGEKYQLKGSEVYNCSHRDILEEYILTQTTDLTKKVIAHSLFIDDSESEELYEYFSHYNKEIFEFISLPIEEKLMQELQKIAKRPLFVFLSHTKEMKEQLELKRMGEEILGL